MDYKLGISGNGHLIRVINELYAFEKELDMISLKIYPSESLKVIITEELIPITKEIRDIFIEQRNKLLDDKTYSLSSNLKALDRYWLSGALQNFARAISTADIKSHPLEIMNSFKSIIKAVDHEDFEIITSPREELNFSFCELWHPIKSKLKTMGIKTNNEKKFIELTFPKQHKNNVLLAGIYAHEIGHYFDRNKKMWLEILDEEQKNPEIKNLMPYFKKTINQTVLNELEFFSILPHSTLGYWIREAIADCVGVYLLGPAFIFSSLEINISKTASSIVTDDHLKDFISHTHPRHGLRFYFQMDILKSMSIYKSLPKSIKEIFDIEKKAWENSESYCKFGIINLSSEVFFEVNKDSIIQLEKAWRACLSNVSKKVKKLLGKNIIEEKNILDALKLAEERVKILVPPNEIDNHPSSFQAIINSGWIGKLCYENELLSLIQKQSYEESIYEVDYVINNLLRYALQVSQLQTRWNTGCR